MIINRIYETQNLPSLNLFSFVIGLRTYQHPCILFDGENISFDASLVIYRVSREECARRRENVP